MCAIVPAPAATALPIDLDSTDASDRPPSVTVKRPQHIAQFSTTGQLLNWRFNSVQNQLTFTTSTGVQPQAQLISDPTRLVIDLPGITLGRSAVTQALSGQFRSLRVGQFDQMTTRIVLELDASYTLDPNQVRFRGTAPNSWIVQLASPQRLSRSSPPTESVVAPSPPPGVNPASPPPGVNPASPPAAATPATPAASAAAGSTQVEEIRVTNDGFFIRTTGSDPQIQVQRSSDRRRVTLIFENTTLAPPAPRPDLVVGRLGVDRVRVAQSLATPSKVYVSLFVEVQGPDWQSRLIKTSSLSGIVLLPTGSPQLANLGTQPPRPNLTPTPSPIPPRSQLPPVLGTLPQRPSPGNPAVTIPVPAANPSLATIQSIDFQNNDTQLVIQADQPVVYTSGWDRATGAYRINLTARLAPNFRSPRTYASSPALRLLVRQETASTLVVLLQPAANVQIGAIRQRSPQQLTLDLTRSTTIAIPPTASPQPILPSNPYPAVSRPRLNQGRPVVVIDPGHGGPDPGAIGIGGLWEKEIVIDISRQVASRLEQQGIQVVLTRSDDRDVGLEPRVQLARQVNATIFVSIHANAISMSRPDINGLETYFYSSGATLAQMIHQNVLQTTDLRDRRVRTARFYVLRRSAMPAVLVETGYVTGQEDAARFMTPTGRSRIAEGIARGIVQYLQSY
jgi:N-acetylmuramoyl-L-alanine amidase